MTFVKFAVLLKRGHESHCCRSKWVELKTIQSWRLFKENDI